MNGTTVVFGYGAIGRLVADRLVARGDTVRVAQRHPPDAPVPGIAFVVCDVLEAADVRRAVEGAAQVVLAFGFPYDSRVWRTAWPLAMTNVVEACAAVGARVVFVDNLYQLGPRTEPRHEGMSLTTQGEKPAILTETTHIWMAARDRLRVAALRCPDFYGPGVQVSHLGASAFGELAAGRRAQMYAPLDTPHDFAYAPDIARAVVTLLDAPDDAYGQAWHVPCAPTRTAREILALGAAELGRPLRVLGVPFRLLPVVALFSRMVREMLDVGFTFDRPYVVDSTRFGRRFWSDATPFEVGAPATVRAFAAAVS